MSITKDFYSVFILDNEDKPVEQKDLVVFALEHGTEYKIKIVNHHKTMRANASVVVDGKRVGYFRINKDSSITIDRPDDKARRLTFFKLGSSEAKKGGLSQANKDLGTFRITLEKERKPVPKQFTGFNFGFCDIQCDGPGGDQCDGGARLGGTALGKASSQRFSQASEMLTEDLVVVIRGLMVMADDITPL